ncbi:hypothetical protein Pfo_012780 [Paulownia fortunei]|nr:hypothetical protein Pfo_012780 [Paulownia fortunei]
MEQQLVVALMMVVAEAAAAVEWVLDMVFDRSDPLLLVLVVVVHVAILVDKSVAKGIKDLPSYLVLEADEPHFCV